MRRTLLGAAVLLALPACSAESAPVPAVPWASPATDATSGMGGAPAPPGALDGKRQVFLLPRLDDNELPDTRLAVTPGGRVQVTENDTGGALFVPLPGGGSGPERLIRTVPPRAGDRPSCLQVSGGAPAIVRTAACDPGEPAQLFTFEAAGEDDEGRAVYAVRNRDAVLQWRPLGGTGLVAAPPGASPVETTFTLLDQGAAPPPATG